MLDRTLVGALLAGALLPGAALASPRFARLGSFEGPVEVQLDAADSWRPATVNLPLAQSTRIRTGPSAKVEIELDDSSVFRMVGEGLAELSDYLRLSGGQAITVISLDHGRAYFTGDPGKGNTIDLLIPGAQASLKLGSRIRLAALDDASEIAIIEGAVAFTIPSAEMDLHGGQSARVNVPDSMQFTLAREIVPVDSDQWSEQLDKAEARAPASRLDLDAAGKWITDGDYGTVWQPSARAGWAPFRQGRWIWYQAVGYTWVAAEPWGWKPYHEGRWLQHPDLGWVWVPGLPNASFSPGDVFWAISSNRTVWGPLAPAEQWNGAGPPRQFAALNVTSGIYASGAQEIVASPAEDLPNDLLKTFLFTAALPSPPLPLARLKATREPLRTQVYSAVEVTPAVPVSEVSPTSDSDSQPVADNAPPLQPASGPPPPDPDPYPPPVVLAPYPVGIVVIEPPPTNSSSRSSGNPSAITRPGSISSGVSGFGGSGSGQTTTTLGSHRVPPADPKPEREPRKDPPIEIHRIETQASAEPVSRPPASAPHVAPATPPVRVEAPKVEVKNDTTKTK